MDTIKISYTIWRKHGDNLYCRVRQRGVKCFDVNLHTTEQSKAEAFVRLRRQELELYNSYVLMGETVPEDVERKLLRRGNPTANTAKQTPTLRKCLDEFELALRRKGSREPTVTTYCKEIRLTVDLDLTLADFTASNVRKWLSKHDHCKTSTRKGYSVALREFAKYLVDNGELDPRVLLGWPMVKVQQDEKGYWTLTQMYHIINSIECVDKDRESSMKAFCWVMATCGSRHGETGMLKWSDFRDGVLTFRAETTKSNRTRRVPLDLRVVEMLARLPRKGELIFADIPPDQAGRYSIVAKAVKRAGAPKGGLHIFRHSASMLLYAKCQDIKAVSQMLGHSEATALKYYQTSREADELRNVVHTAFDGEAMIPSVTDELIKAGLW